MARIYICRIIGRGTKNDPYRAAAGDVSGVTSCRACISSRFDGRPALNWSIVRVEASDYDAVDAAPGVIAVPPGVSLDTVIPAAYRTALENKAAALGFDITIPVGTTVRQLLRALVRRHYAHADEGAVL